MDKNLSTILAVALAGIIQVAVTEGPFTLWNVMIGVVLICILLTYRCSKIRLHELAALSAVWGLTIVITTGVFVQRLFPELPRLKNGEVRPRYFFIIWLFVSALAFATRFILKRTKDSRMLKRWSKILNTEL